MFRPWAVQRPRITGRIAEGPRWCPLTVVTGPAGAGKTMAVAMWAAADAGRVAWVCLDEFDNRPAASWSDVVAALRRSGVTVPKTLQAIPQEPAGVDGFLLGLTALLAAQDVPLTLVLDDLHLLTEPGTLKGLDFMLRNAGSGLRVVVTSRMDPLLPLHRYRVAGQLTEVRADDLAFSAAEASLLLAQHGSTLPGARPGEPDAANRGLGGRPGALAAMSLGADPDPGQFIKELLTEDSALICYLVDEVLNVQLPEVREVLLSTSILEHVSADAAVEVTGDKHAAGILASLAHTNAFVQPLAPGWYRYHTLFAEMLRLKLRLEHPERVAVLHQRAARWHQREGRSPTRCGTPPRRADWPLAAAIVVDELAVGELAERGAGHPLAAEFAAMPADRAWAEPRRTWWRRPSRWPLGAAKRPPPRSTPRTACWIACLLTEGPRAGWPPPSSASPPPFARETWREPRRRPAVPGGCSPGSRRRSWPGIQSSRGPCCLAGPP